MIKMLEGVKIWLSASIWRW